MKKNDVLDRYLSTSSNKRFGAYCGFLLRTSVCVCMWCVFVHHAGQFFFGAFQVSLSEKKENRFFSFFVLCVCVCVSSIIVVTKLNEELEPSAYETPPAFLVGGSGV